jgi:hypothetical protein
LVASNRNQNRSIRSSMGDCHSFDPGSKFGLEKSKEKKQPNEHPGPGAAYTFLVLQLQILRNYNNKTWESVTVTVSDVIA